MPARKRRRVGKHRIGIKQTAHPSAHDMFSSGLLHERFPWYPLWAPSYESLLSLPEAVLDNAKAVLLDPTKDKKDIAIEVTIVFVQYVALLFAFLGVPPLPPPPWFLAQFAGVALASSSSGRRRSRVNL